MKKLVLIFGLFALMLITSCSSTNTAFYNSGNNENWEINVVHKSGVTDYFKVIINDSTVIDKAANFITGSLEEKNNYRNKEIKLHVTYSEGFLGIGEAFHAMVFINNQLAAKFEF